MPPWKNTWIAIRGVRNVSQEMTAMPPLPLGFVEVPSAPAWPKPSGATQVELHRVDGTRLCIHSAESTLPLEALVRAFLEVH